MATKKISALPAAAALSGTEDIPGVQSAATVRMTPQAIANLLLASPAFTGVPTAPTATAGNNSTQIATTAYVDAVVVAADSVTFAKMQNIATDTLIGRDTAGSGDPESISLGGGLAFSGLGSIWREALTGDVTAPIASNATTIANNAVTFAKMADIATDRLVGRDTASTGDPEAITVGGGIEFTGSGGIQVSAFTGDVTKSAGSTSLALTSGVVTTVKIADANVTFAKMQNIATDSLVGRDTAATGVPENILLNATLEMDGSGNLRRAALTGDVTATAGSNATVVATINALATAAEVNRVCDVSTRLIAAGSTLSVTEAAHDGKTIKLDTLAGSVCTLPAATGSGARFRFLVTVLATSNSHIVKVANASDIIQGVLSSMDVDGGAAIVGWGTAADTDTITLDRSVTGSVRRGEWFEVEDVAANLWLVRGQLANTGTALTPFSATV